VVLSRQTTRITCFRKIWQIKRSIFVEPCMLKGRNQQRGENQQRNRTFVSVVKEWLQTTVPGIGCFLEVVVGKRPTSLWFFSCYPQSNMLVAHRWRKGCVMTIEQGKVSHLRWVRMVTSTEVDLVQLILWWACVIHEYSKSFWMMKPTHTAAVERFSGREQLAVGRWGVEDDNVP